MNFLFPTNAKNIPISPPESHYFSQRFSSSSRCRALGGGKKKGLPMIQLPTAPERLRN